MGERAEVEDTTTVDGHDCTLLRPKEILPLSHWKDFSSAEIYLVDLVLKRYERMPLKRVISDVVYETEPMKGAEFDEPLPMEDQRNKDRDQAGGISLEAILDAREAFARGEYVMLESLRGELLGARP